MCSIVASCARGGYSSYDSFAVDGWLDCAACALGCNVDGTRCNQLEPSNLPAALMTMGTDALAPSTAAGATLSINTETGLIQFETGAVLRHSGSGMVDGIYLEVIDQDQEDVPAIAVFSVTAIDIPAALDVVATGNNALALFASEEVSIAGRLLLVGGVPDAAPGGYPGGSGSSAGQGPGGGLPPEPSGEPDSGGGGAGHTAVGGVAGRDLPDGRGGEGGPVYGNELLIPLLGGSGGGGSCLPGASGSIGGGGGGAVQITALGSLTILASGGIHAGGGPGRAGQAGARNAGGGGGGSGGAILLEAPRISVEGILAANGGGGGGGGCATEAGQDGAPGELGPTPAPGGQGSAGGGRGGQGGAVSIPGGGAGASDWWAGGGGGGGIGRIRLNTALGSADISGVLSPGATQGTLSYHREGV